MDESFSAERVADRCNFPSTAKTPSTTVSA
jgi:hypothetical protein